MSVSVLDSLIKEKRNPTVAGLDPRIEYVPEHIRSKYPDTMEGRAEAVLEFNRDLIDALYDVVPAVKPQAAYYELLGTAGMRIFRETMEYAHSKGLYIIADIKRGDIGPTAAAYAEAYLGEDQNGVRAFPADSVTVNPYLGTDGIAPFIAACEKYGKSIFVLVKTSNPSSGELQNRDMEGRTMYERVAELIGGLASNTPDGERWSRVGAVVGATYPEEQKRLRALLPSSYFLVPGYGAQGAGAEDIKNAFTGDGSGAVVNSSRAIMCAWKKTGNNGADYMQAARAEALRMRDELRAVLGI